MSATGLDVFDKTLQTTHIWLDEIMLDLGPDRQVAWHVLGAVLRALRDRLPMELSAHLAAQLPLLVRGLYFDQWRPSEQPAKSRTREEFFERVAADLKSTRPVKLEQAVRAVFRVINHRLDPGQVQNVREALPQPLQTLWPDAARHAAA
jgi:uncharacterized protein (DUF2267 family)